MAAYDTRIDRLRLAHRRIIAITLTAANRRIIRLGLRFRLRNSTLITVWAMTGMLFVIIALFAALIIRQLPYDPMTVLLFTGIFTITATLATLGSYPALYRCLLCPPSWQTYANNGVSLRLFILAKLFFNPARKYFTLLLATIVFLLTFTTKNHTLTDNYPYYLFTIAFLLVSSVLTYALGTSYLMIRAFWFKTLTARRKLYAALAITVAAGLIFSCSAAIGRIFVTQPGNQTQQTTTTIMVISSIIYENSWIALPILLLLTSSVSIVCLRLFNHLGKVPWSSIMNVHAGAAAPGTVELTLPTNPTLAIIVIDTRRLLRSVSARLNSLFISLLILCGIAFGLVLINWWVTAAGIHWLDYLPPSTPAIIAGALAASVVFTIHSALSPVFDLDADRSAYKLWQTVPRMLRTVAVARTLTRSLLLLLCSIPAIAAAIALAGIGPPAYPTVLLSAAAIVTIAPSLSAMVSLKWPHYQWKEVGEVGTIGISRYLLTYQLPPILMLVLALTSTITLSVPVANSLSLAVLGIAPVTASLLVFSYATIVRWPRIDKS